MLRIHALRALRDPAIARHVLLVAILGLVLGPLGSALHHAGVEHEYCARHGVLEHVRDGAAAPAETPRVDPDPSNTATDSDHRQHGGDTHDSRQPSSPERSGHGRGHGDSGDSGGSDSHDPCTMPLAVAFDRPALPEFAPALLHHDAGPRPIAPQPSARPSVAILRFAPKTSPPILS